MPTTTLNDNRPPVAIGHVRLSANNVEASSKFFVELGLRSIHQSDSIAVLELRGGTHLVVRPADEGIAPGTKAPFDLMVDDLEVARKQYGDAGMEPSAIEEGSIHNWFTIIEPSGYEITITSSHAGSRAV